MHKMSPLIPALAAGALASTAAAQTPPAITMGTARAYLDTTADAGSASLDMAVAPGEPANRMFFVTQGGTVRLYKNGALQAANYFNVASYVPLRASGEQGLLGFAFHPDFNTSGAAGFGKFYTFTSETKSGTADFNHPELGATGGTNHSVITEWTTNPALDTHAAMPTRRELMRINQPQANHNGGALRFGNDNNLYISTGDGGGGNDQHTDPNPVPPITLANDGHTNDTGNGQDINVVYGKVLRINPLGSNSANGKYGVPADNPFAGATAGVDEIFAHGLRNPFRMNFDRATGKLYVGDVGQGQREEIDVMDPSVTPPAAGRNYGWVYMEGTRVNRTPPAGFSSVAPIGEYTSGDGHSVMGGFVYHGSIPELQGRYVFGDYNGNANRGRLFHMPVAGGVGTIQEFVYSGAATGGGTHPISSTLYGWGEDAQGELYALFANGEVRRLLGDHQWRPTTGGSWDTAGNWTSGTGSGSTWTSVAPNAAGAQARFLNGPTAPVTVTLSSDKTVGLITFSNSNRYTIAGPGAITLNWGAAASGIDVLKGSHTIATPVTLATSSIINVTPAASVLTMGDVAASAAAPTGTSLTKAGAGTLEVSRFGVSRLTVSAGTMKVLPNGGAAGVGRARELVIAGGATLHLADNDILIDYAPASGSPHDALRAHVLDGRDGAGGIVTTLTTDTTLALAEASEKGVTQWLGQTVDATTIIGKYTYFGDANMDGKVTGDDYLNVDANLGTGNSWLEGDFNMSGQTTGDDYLAIDANLGKGTLTPLAWAELKAEMVALHAAMFGDEYLTKLALVEAHGFAVVPEPAGLVFVGAAALLARRRRRISA